MSFRVAVGGLLHETNTYAVGSTGPTGLERFQVLRGDEILVQRGMKMPVGGMLVAADSLGATVVPTFHALAFPSGTIAADAYMSLRTELTAAIEAALPVDAIALDLHGAAVAEGTDDVEADVGAALRALVGRDIPIVAVLDLHGNVTDEMANLYDLLLGYHLYPHMDTDERGEEAIRAIPSLLSGDLRPVIHIEHLPMPCPPRRRNRERRPRP